MASEPLPEVLDVAVVVDIARGEHRLAERDSEVRAPRSPPGQARLRPSSMHAPQPDGDHRNAGGEGDPRDAAPDAEQRRGVGVHGPLGGDREDDAALHCREGGVECRSVAFSPTDRYLVVATEDPADHPTVEELRCYKEPALTLDPTSELDREDRTVERAGVVERQDRGAAERYMLDPNDAHPEDDPDEWGDDREADTPPAVQLTPGHERHASVRPMDALAIRDLVAARLDRFVAALEAMVNVDCGTFNRDGVNRIADLCEEALDEGGWSVERIPHEPRNGGPRLGDTVVGTLRGVGGPNVLLLGHMDTVFDDGAASQRPFTVEGDRALGPGVSDMKGGLLAGFFAVGALREADFDGFERITYVCDADEEIGSPSSKELIRKLAGEHDAALVLECARANGNVVSARKGVTDYQIRIHGRAAHAGVEPEKGRSAVIEAAHQAIAIAALHGRWPGVSCNVGILRGGTRTNVVAEEAVLEVELRSPELATLEEAEREVERICAEPTIDGVTISVLSEGWHRPMEKTAASQRLVDVAVGVAGELGFSLADSATGGASDGNTTAAAGCPTLDGLGPIGGGAHAPDEWLDLASVVPRTALLAGVIARL
jgi:glutamate carboxypeptidase